MLLLGLFALAAAAHAAAPQKVKVCHIPPGNPANFHTITISENALQAHLAHGDLAGSCAQSCDQLCSDDECASSPCINGDCTDQLNGYTCFCFPGWTGTNCDVAAAATYNCTDRNPCTQDNIDNGLFYFSADDPTQFIQCSEWGQCYVMDCPPGLVWDQDVLTCTSP